MDSTQLALSLALASLLIELTPGPNMAWLALLAATKGRMRGFAAVAGVGVGLGLMGLAAAMGLTALLQAQPLAYQALRWAGWPICCGWPGRPGASRRKKRAAMPGNPCLPRSGRG